MDTIDEFDRKYRETYIQYKHQGRFLVAKVIGTDLDNVLVLDVDELGMTPIKYPKCLENLQLETPNAGYFNHDNHPIGHALFIFKSPTRQWQRGLTSQTHEIYNPFRKFLIDGVYRPHWGPRLAHSMFTRGFISSVLAALQTLQEGRISTAVSSNIMFSLSPVNKDDKLVWWRTLPVGVVKQDKQIVIHDELYEQEVRDELRKLGQEHWINY